MKLFDMLYKRSSSGKVLVWYMEVDRDRYRSTSGQLDGKKTTTEWTVAKPKNVGRSNETTGEQQALLEVQAEYDKKLARDYHRSIEAIDQQMRFKPMLATKWQDRKDKLGSGSVFIQPKLDGIRCILNKGGMWSREGKPLLGTPHIKEVIDDLYGEFFANNPNLIFDGELYNHEYKDDFNKIVSAVKKQKPSASDLYTARELIQYHIYDVPSMAKHRFSERNNALVQNWIDHQSLQLVETIECDIQEVDDWALRFVAQGYEGAIIRLDGEYENKRSNNLIKWKEFQDEEFTIVDIHEGEGNRAGIAARVILALPDRRTFAAGMIGNVEYCRQLLLDKEKHIGKNGTVVFQNYTPDGVPRFPKFKGVRDYE